MEDNENSTDFQSEDDDVIDFSNSEPGNSKISSKSRLSKKAKIIILIFAILSPISAFTAYYLSSNQSPKPDLTVMISMRDGVNLATDIYLPDGEGPFPIVLYRTPYGRKTDSVSLATFLNEYGIGFITQDHRGCHDSEGLYTAFGSDGRDANDTVEWMKNQSWFNGKYAAQGGSARGITQYKQVEELDDILCQFIEVATPDLYHQAMWQGGVPRRMLAQTWLKGISHEDYYFDSLVTQPFNNDTFAADHIISTEEYANVTWPSVHRGGWYDCFSQGTITGFMNYQYNGGEGGAGNAKMIIGPWTHALSTKNAGDLEYPENAEDDPWSDKIYESMFGELLIGYTSEYGDWRDMPNVTYYVMGDVETSSSNWNRWAISDVWPVDHTDDVWYLQNDNSLSTILPVSDSQYDYVFDPSDPIITKGGSNLVRDNRGPMDQDSVYEDRDDMVRFTHTITDEPYLITGHISAHLYITSNCTDTDFTVKLMDQYPDGSSMLICDGITRMRYREGQNQSILMDGSGSTVYECDVDLWSSSYVFNVGHQLEVVVSSSNYPRFDVNPNTSAEIVDFVTENPEYLHANNSILTGPNYPSCINLPVPSSAPNWN